MRKRKIPVINARLFNRTADTIERRSEAFWQDQYGVYKDDALGETVLKPSSDNRCCIASWMYFVHVGERQHIMFRGVRSGVKAVWRQARDAAGLLNWEADQLFWHHWPKFWREAVLGEHPLVTDGLRYGHLMGYSPTAEEAVTVLRHIAQHGFDRKE